jgi:hypothetical protein
VDKNTSYMMDECEELGMHDPFPNENEDAPASMFTIPELATDFVYPAGRMVE